MVITDASVLSSKQADKIQAQQVQFINRRAVALYIIALTDTNKSNRCWRIEIKANVYKSSKHYERQNNNNNNNADGYSSSSGGGSGFDDDNILKTKRKKKRMKIKGQG